MWEKTKQSLHCGRDKGIQHLCHSRPFHSFAIDYNILMKLKMYLCDHEYTSTCIWRQPIDSTIPTHRCVALDITRVSVKTGSFTGLFLFINLQTGISTDRGEL